MDIQEIPGIDAPDVDVAPVMYTILTWIGFDQQGATRDRIREEEDGLATFENLTPMKEKDICDLGAHSNGRRSVGDGRLILGLRRSRGYLNG